MKEPRKARGWDCVFLRHIERNSVLLFVIPADSQDIAKEYQVLLGELEKYNPELLDKERILAISKSDLLDEELLQELTAELSLPITYIFISSATNKGLEQLKDYIWKTLQ